METDLSTSTAATLEARHDRYDQPIPREEFPQTASPLAEMRERKISQYLEESSSLRRSDDVSSNSSSSSMTEQPVDVSYSLIPEDNLGDQEDRKSFALTVRMQRTKAGGDSRSSEGSNAVSMDSFEAVFEDESEDEGDDLYPEKSRVLSTHDIRALYNESESSNFSPESHSDRDGEGEDNMSAITWPDMAMRKEVAISPQAYDIPSKYLRRNEAAEEGRVSESNPLDMSSYNQLRESDSIDEDGLLQELDELSVSWARRKKNLEEKGRYS
jgi:hypothetical protein